MTESPTAFHSAKKTESFQDPTIRSPNVCDDIKTQSAPHPINRNSPPILSHENLEHHNAVHFPKVSTNSESRDDVHIIVETTAPPSTSSCSCSEDTHLEHEGPAELPLTPTPETNTPRPNHVRFRPRVRITSGISRHRHHRYPTPGGGQVPPSRDSSLESSPSSSISAPLRSRSDDESNKPGWGPLGQRVALLSYNSPRRWAKDKRRRKGDTHPPDENTSLLGSAFRTPYSEGSPIYGDYVTEADREEEAHITQELNKAFGTWPGRALNPHWWWWQLEPVVFCRCLEESDTE